MSLSNIIKALYLMIWPLFRFLGRNLSIFSLFFGKFKTSKRLFEINWPISDEQEYIHKIGFYWITISCILVLFATYICLWFAYLINDTPVSNKKNNHNILWTKFGNFGHSEVWRIELLETPRAYTPETHCAVGNFIRCFFSSF